MDNNSKEAALQSAVDYITRLIGSIDVIYLHLQQGRTREGMEVLGFFFEGLEWLQQVIHMTADIQRNSIDIQAIKCELEQIDSAMHKKDYVQMCDILLYELKPVLEKWERNLKNETSAIN